MMMKVFGLKAADLKSRVINCSDARNYPFHLDSDVIQSEDSDWLSRIGSSYQDIRDKEVLHNELDW